MLIFCLENNSFNGAGAVRSASPSLRTDSAPRGSNDDDAGFDVAFRARLLGAGFPPPLWSPTPLVAPVDSGLGRRLVSGVAHLRGASERAGRGLFFGFFF